MSVWIFQWLAVFWQVTVCNLFTDCSRTLICLGTKHVTIYDLVTESFTEPICESHWIILATDWSQHTDEFRNEAIDCLWVSHWIICWTDMWESLNRFCNRFVPTHWLIQEQNIGLSLTMSLKHLLEQFVRVIESCSQLICIKTDRWFIHGTKKVTVFMREQTH